MVLSNDFSIPQRTVFASEIAILRLFHHYVLIFSAAKKIFTVVNTTDDLLGLTVWPHCSEELSKLRGKNLGYYVRNV